MNNEKSSKIVLNKEDLIMLIQVFELTFSTEDLINIFLSGVTLDQKRQFFLLKEKLKVIYSSDEIRVGVE
jgi:hypothetical protein